MQTDERDHHIRHSSF